MVSLTSQTLTDGVERRTVGRDRGGVGGGGGGEDVEEEEEGSYRKGRGRERESQRAEGDEEARREGWAEETRRRESSEVNELGLVVCLKQRSIQKSSGADSASSEEWIRKNLLVTKLFHRSVDSASLLPSPTLSLSPPSLPFHRRSDIYPF